MGRYDPKFDLKINVSHCDLYFMVQWFCLISWRLFDIWPPYFGIMSQYGPMFDIKINVGQYDLYFMVQWFCLISWRLFDIWTPYFGIMSQYDLMFDLKINVGHCDLYFIVHWFCLISLYLVDECHTFGKWVSVIWSSDLSFFNVCSEKHFSFIGKARFRRATQSCHSSYFYNMFKSPYLALTHMYVSDGDKDVYCVCTHSLLVGMHGHFKPIFHSHMYLDKTSRQSIYKDTKIFSNTD